MTLLDVEALYFVLLLVVSSISSGYISKIPGSIPTSYKIEENKYACPVKEGREGSGTKVTLRVTLCSGSSSHALTCPNFYDSNVYILGPGVNVSIIEGSEYFFNTYGIAKYYGFETCVSWMYVNTDAANRVTAAECRSKCFVHSLAPQLSYRNDVEKSKNRYAEQYYKFHAEQKSGIACVGNIGFVFMLPLLHTLIVAW